MHICKSKENGKFLLTQKPKKNLVRPYGTDEPLVRKPSYESNE